MTVTIHDKSVRNLVNNLVKDAAFEERTKMYSTRIPLESAAKLSVLANRLGISPSKLFGKLADSAISEASKAYIENLQANGHDDAIIDFGEAYQQALLDMSEL